jgi:hypothetical protein
MFCCYSQERPDGRKTLKVIARNIYKELSVEDLRSELLRTKAEISDYEDLLRNSKKIKQEEVQEINLYLSKLRFKESAIKDLFKVKAKEENLDLDQNDTLGLVDEVFNQKKHEATHRMRGLYTYDIKENPDFRESQKTEEKVREYF